MQYEFILSTRFEIMLTKYKLSDKKETPLHFAVRIGRTDVVKLLVSYGADTSLVGYWAFYSENRQTPLMWAHIVRRQGLSPVGLARKAGFVQIADLIRDAVELQNFLKEHDLSKYVA